MIIPQYKPLYTDQEFLDCLYALYASIHKEIDLYSDDVNIEPRCPVHLFVFAGSVGFLIQELKNRIKSQ